MKVLIIEDEAPAFRRFQKILEEIDPSIEILEVIDSVNDSVKWIRNHSHPDVIFMDIQLSDGISFEIFEQVEIQSPVIFTTAFDEYMLRAFKVNSIDYLLKPIKKEDLMQSIQKYRQLKTVFSGDANMSELVKMIRLDERKFKTRFLVKQGDKLLSIQTDEIQYFQTKNGVVYLATRGKKFLLDQSLEDLSGQLDPEKFYRANRQFLIHYDAIKTVHKYHKGKLLVELTDPVDEQIVVSSEKATDFKQWLD